MIQQHTRSASCILSHQAVTPLTTQSSSRMRVVNHNWSATKQHLHPQSVAEISRHSVKAVHTNVIDENKWIDDLDSNIATVDLRKRSVVCTESNATVLADTDDKNDVFVVTGLSNIAAAAAAAAAAACVILFLCTLIDRTYKSLHDLRNSTR